MKKSVITLRDGAKTIRIEMPVDTSSVETLFNSIRREIAEYCIQGRVIESIYFYEEETMADIFGKIPQGGMGQY